MKEIWILLCLIVILDSYECEPHDEIARALTETTKNMNMMKMFDRFYHVRHEDEFFKFNVKDIITDDNYLRKHYSSEMTETLKNDIISQAVYFENIGWYSTSLTELLVALYMKFLASDYILSFKYCSDFYKDVTVNEVMSKTCKKVAEYLLTFVQLGLEGVLRRTKNLLQLILKDEDEENWRQYQITLFSINHYFSSIRAYVQYNNQLHDVSIDKLEFFKKVLEKEIYSASLSIKKMHIKDFFKNLFFGIRIRNETELIRANQKKKSDLKNLDTKTIETIYQKNIGYWKMADSLVEKIEEIDPERTKFNFDDMGKGKIFASNATEIIRDLELEKLARLGINKKNQPQFRLGTPRQILRLVIEPTSKFGHQMQYIPVTREELMTPMNTSKYFKTIELLSSVDLLNKKPGKDEPSSATSSIFESSEVKEDLSDNSYATAISTNASASAATLANASAPALLESINENSVPYISAGDHRLPEKRAKFTPRVNNSVHGVDNNVSKQTEFSSAVDEGDSEKTQIMHFTPKLTKEQRDKLREYVIRDSLESALSKSEARSDHSKKYVNKAPISHYPPLIEVANG